MPKLSAALLLYRVTDGGVQVLIGQRLPGIREVDPYRHPRHRGSSLLEELEGFGDHAGREGRQARDVASRSRQAGHKPAPDGITDGNHDDRGCLRRLLGRQGRRRARGNEDIYLETNQLGRQAGESVGRPWCAPAFNDDVLALDVTELAQPLTQWAHLVRTNRTP